ncbi:MAG: ABC transporter substrate-binding protein [Myxococcota bacterium]|nr:ABC transporter substrate-binding protein [Myxococcota bacterium]
MKKIATGGLGLLIALGLALGCQPQGPQVPEKDAVAPEKKAEAPAAATLRGVDMEKKVIRIGTLNDESGPAAVIGKPFAVGKRILAAQVNAGGSGYLPDGWTVELIEKDHAYNPGKAEAGYKEIKDQVLFIGTSFGTPNTLPLQPFLKQDTMVAFPASLSSAMASFELTPPVGASYSIEAMRAVDYAVESAGGADKIKLAIIYQQDDFGKDGLAGMKKAAEFHKVTVVSEQAVAPGQKDFTAVIGALKQAGATHVLLTTLASSTGPVLGTAAKMKYMPNWIGQTPSWIDPFFAHPQLPAPLFGKFVWVTGATFWGEQVPGMDTFLAAFKEHAAAAGARPDFYTMMSYLQGALALEAASQALAANDISPAGYLKALRGIEGWNGGGMVQPVSLKQFPYLTGSTTRVLKPDFEKKSWSVLSDFASPKSMAAPAAAAEDAAPKGG